MVNRTNKPFSKVPLEQYSHLQNFRKNHPVEVRTSNGKTYEYIRAGEGELTLVFLHGTMVEPDMWFYPITALSRDYQILGPKFKKTGMGGNEAVDYVKEIMDLEGVKSAVIIGYSYGGGVAQYFAEVYPQYVDLLVLTHTGILRREDAIERTAAFLKKLKFIPGFSLNILKFLRSQSGKDSPWYQFRKAYLNEMFSKVSKADFIELYTRNLQFLREVDHLEVGKVSWSGKTVILGTTSDTDTYQHFDTLKTIYPNHRSYAFDKPGGHHMIFLYPEEYSRKLGELIQTALND